MILGRYHQMHLLAACSAIIPTACGRSQCGVSRRLTFCQKSTQFAGTTGWRLHLFFYLPVLRIIALAGDGRSATKSFMREALRQKQGLAVHPGGIREQVGTDPKQEHAVFPKNLGFIRLAIEQGKPLCPVYSFGENSTFLIPSWGPSVSKWLYQRMHIPLPFGFPLGPLHRHKVYVRYGRLVDTGLGCASPSESQVQEVFRSYVEELRRLFNEYSHLLDPGVARRGLRMTWDGKLLEDERAPRSRL